MKLIYSILPIFYVLLLSPIHGEAKKETPKDLALQSLSKSAKAEERCIQALGPMAEKVPSWNMSVGELCSKSSKIDAILEVCKSQNGIDIPHFSFLKNRRGKRVIVFALVHGDEMESGFVALRWIERLTGLENSRNEWVVVPQLNPDGFLKKSRLNARGVDLNRNFPSNDWHELALKKWQKTQIKRRFPGNAPASEPETLCAMKLLEHYQPDFVISIHTPYGVLDFDGPTEAFKPSFSGHPWVSLGTYPGSLGRYLWKDQNIPVLTIELKDDQILKNIDRMDSLQDIAGSVAMSIEKDKK